MSNINDVISFGSIKNDCKYCHASSYCLPNNLNTDELITFNQFVKRRKPLQRGECLYQGGDNFHSIYIVHSGSVKTCVASSDGEQQITGFYFAGDLLGIDGIDDGRHAYTVEALETSSFCEIHFNKFSEIAKKIPLLQQHFFRIVSREINHEQELMLLLGRMDSKRRLACFLMKMSSCMQVQGCSSHNLNLSMTRHDIANYLGLAIETVSRLLTSFHNNGILEVKYRNIIIKNPKELQCIAENIPNDGHVIEEIA